MNKVKKNNVLKNLRAYSMIIVLIANYIAKKRANTSLV